MDVSQIHLARVKWQHSGIVNRTAADQGSSGTVSSTGNDVDALVQVNHDGLIEKASQLPQLDPNAVQRARELLESGELDSEANIRAAAENIIKFGI